MQCFLIVTILWVFSVCLHEFGHAWVAYRGGDFTVAEKGYLTMNPLRYTHPVYSIVFPLVFLALGGIGLPGGAVYINRELLRSRAWSTAVSLAGPAAQVILILVIGTLFKTGVIPPDRNSMMTISMAFLFRLQASALLLNLIPIPPLDGFQAIAPWLKPELRDKLFQLSNVGPLILFLLLWQVEPFSNAFQQAEQAIGNIFGVERIWVYYGYRTFRFWES